MKNAWPFLALLAFCMGLVIALDASNGRIRRLERQVEYLEAVRKHKGPDVAKGKR